MKARAHISTTQTEPIDQPLTGIAFVLLGVLLFTFQDAVIKWISGGLAVHQLAILRSFFALVPILIIVRLSGGLATLRTRRLGLHAVRAFLMFNSFTCLYLALAVMSLASAIALTFSAPLFVAALSVPLLSERVGWRRWLAIVVGFAGVLIMLRPGVGVFEPAALLALFSAFTYALAMIVTRRLGATDSGASMALYTTLFYIVMGAAIGLALGHGRFATASTHPSLQFLLRAWTLPAPQDLALVALVGFTSGIGFYALSQAYRAAPVTTVAPFEYLGVPLAVLIGYLVWGDLPELHTWIGMALVVLSGLVVVRREAARSMRRRSHPTPVLHPRPMTSAAVPPPEETAHDDQ